MGKPKDEKPLTHEEIWDDSSLVRSWEDAVEEYQLYHSIHAKGEKVEDVLREAEEEQIPPSAGDDQDEDVAMTGENEDSNVPIPDTKEPVAAQVSSESVETPVAEEAITAAAQGPKTPTNAMPMPEPILAHVQDESLKRLMMSWYYAGYYTGLYEGQQQARSSKE